MARIVGRSLAAAIEANTEELRQRRERALTVGEPDCGVRVRRADRAVRVGRADRGVRVGEPTGG